MSPGETFIVETLDAFGNRVTGGTATLNDQDIWDEARRIMVRYVPGDEIDQHLEMWKTQPRVLVTVTPTRISSRGR